MSETFDLVINAELAEQIRAHGVATYPHECCGALFGRDTGAAGAREVLALFPLVNRRDDSAHNRFSVSSEDVILADKKAREQGLDVIGWYHSHPDHPARPSQYDRDHAWPWYSYVIVSVQQRVAQEMTSWRLSDDRGEFAPEAIAIRQRVLA
jgi:proteasome lid subunit RPN8/RPN11